jgi:ketosteroid isomerase-like protein
MWQVSPDLHAIAEAVYGAINAGDLDAFVAWTHEDVEFRSPVAEPEAATFQGHEGVRAWWATFRTEPEALEAVGLGDSGSTCRTVSS